MFFYYLYRLNFDRLKTNTLKDIAQSLGISITTVSKALKDYPDVSPLTKKKVRDYAKDINFRPNSAAASLRTQQTQTVGIVLPNISNYFFSNVLKGVIDAAEKEGYVVIVLHSNESYELEKKHIERLLFQNVDGIFVSLSQETYDVEHLQKVLDAGKVLIQFDKISKLISSSKVIVDDRQSAYEAVQHLILSGKKRIVHLRGPLLPQVAIDRFLGYKAALAEYRIPFDAELVVTCPKGNDMEGYDALERIWSKKLEIDGVFAHSDLVALGAIRFLKEQSIAIPQQVAVFGFSNWLVSAKVSPTLSTVDQPGMGMGDTIFQQFLKEHNQKIKGQKTQPISLTLPTSLVIRESG